MPAHQSKIAIANGGAAPITRRPPMTSKQAKKAHAQATNGPKMSRAERRRIEAAELAAQKREFERERAQARARAARERREAKEEAERVKRKKAGIPEKNKWVRPSQGRITGFLGLGKRRRSEDIEEDEEEEGDESVDDDNEPILKMVTVNDSEEDTEDSESDVEDKEAGVHNYPGNSPRKSLSHINEADEDAEAEDVPRPKGGGFMDRKESEDPEVQPELQIQRTVELQSEVKVQQEPGSQPELEAKPELEVPLESEVRQDTELQQKPDTQSELEVQPEHDLEGPELPANTQNLSSSQDFPDDDDIFLELATAQQLLSESFHADKKLLAISHLLPDLEAKVILEDVQTNLNNTTATRLSQYRPSPIVKVKSIPVEHPSSSRGRQSESPVLQRTPQPRVNFACSRVSPELTSSNPFSQNQALLRSMNHTIPKLDTAPIASVMGPPTAVIRRNTTLSTPIFSQRKDVPVLSTVSSLSQRASLGDGLSAPGYRQPLGDISRQAQNMPPKAAAPPNHPKPFPPPKRVPSHATAKTSPSDLPTSTQLFLADHLDDFFPSPSQELRELLEDIEDDDIPSNTQVAREIGMDSVTARPLVIEPAQPMFDDNSPWMSSPDFILSSQELRELETPSKAASEPQPTPWDVRRARKPRFFVEKEEDLLAAAIDESRAQGKKDDEAEKLRLENMRFERELLGTRQSSQHQTQRASRPTEDVRRLMRAADDVSEQLDGLKASQLRELVNEVQSDHYSDDFDDEEAEASMIAYAENVESQFAPVQYESESEETDDVNDDYVMAQLFGLGDDYDE